MGGLVLCVAKSTYPWIAERLAPIVDMHFKLIQRHGCMLFHGIKPMIYLHALRLEKDSTLPKLYPIL